MGRELEPRRNGGSGGPGSSFCAPISGPRRGGSRGAVRARPGPPGAGQSSDAWPALALGVSACSRRARDSAKLQRADRDPKAGPDGILSPGASRRWLRMGSELRPFLLYAQDMPLNKTSHSVYLQLPPLVSAAKESFSVYSLAPFLLQSFLKPLQPGVGPPRLH